MGGVATAAVGRQGAKPTSRASASVPRPRHRVGGGETSYKLGYQRPEAVRVVIARAKYKMPREEDAPLPGDATVLEEDGERMTILTAPLPLMLVRRGLCAPSMLARIIVQKFRFGMPYFRQENELAADGIREMFRGFSGYIQADAHTIYDALFRGDAIGDASEAPTEVACWAHCRRRFWEAAVSGFPVGREGLLRIRKLYVLDQAWEDLPPRARLEKRRSILKPFVDEFFDWVRAQNDLTSTERGLVNRALGYALRQEPALRRFLEDGRPRMDNNQSENALRVVASGRKAWLFFRSDDHAEAAANLYSLIAGCKLHRIDPERYLAEVIRVMPYWPRDRYLQLAPVFWTQTRARLDPTELAAELGHITVPPPASERHPLTTSSGRSEPVREPSRRTAKSSTRRPTPSARCQV